MVIIKRSWEVAVPFRQGHALWFPVATSPASPVACSARPCSHVGLQLWLTFPEHSPAVGQSLSTGNKVSAPRGRNSTWLLFCLSKEQFSYSSPLPIPIICPIQFYENLPIIFCVSNQLPPNRLKDRTLDLFLYLDWTWGISFCWQHTYKMQGTSSVLFPVLYGTGMWLLLLVCISKLSYNQSSKMYAPGRKEIGLNVLRGTLPMKRAPRF